LLENCVQEWSKKYVNYAELRSRIKAISKAQAGKEIAPPQRGVVSVDPIPAPISTRKRKESVLEMFKCVHFLVFTVLDIAVYQIPI
jgi:hypothetical protein